MNTDSLPYNVAAVAAVLYSVALAHYWTPQWSWVVPLLPALAIGVWLAAWRYFDVHVEVHVDRSERR